MRYYIADLHFYHGAMNDRMDCRGFSSVEEMNEYMIGKWNGKVRENDEVVIICPGETRRRPASLPGG